VIFTPRHIALLLVGFLCLADTAFSQVQTGTPAFGSFAGGPETINLANLNIHLTIPVLHKAGRGTDFNYNLTYDSSIWNPVYGGWGPTSNWGWTSQSALSSGNLGYLTYTQTTTLCYDGQGHPTGADQYISNSTYYDPWGTIHHFSGYIDAKSGGCGNSQVNTYPGYDGTGMMLQSPTGSIITPSGASISPPVNPTGGGYSSSYTDRNGNQISSDGTGQIFDTLSSTAAVLTISGSNPLTFTYTAPSGAASYKMNFTNYTVATNFRVSGVNEYRSSAAVPLVSSIQLPDGSQYSFTYEPTPGSCNPYAGTTCVTARIKSIKLPTSGTISYSYSGGTNNGGILSDGSTATLTRTTPDGVWAYSQVKGTGAASSTTVGDPQNNQTVIQFQGIYETQRKVYQGAATGSPFVTMNTCYNAATPPATPPCTATVITLPIANRTTNETIPGPGNLQSQHLNKFDSYGNVTESDDYDFATASPFPLLRQTLITYANLGGYLNAFTQTVIIKDVNGTIKSRKDTNYDQYASFTGANCVTGAPNHDDSGHGCNFTARANATSTVSYTDPVTPGGPITKNVTYDSVGNLRTAQLNCCQFKTWTYSTSTYSYAYPDSVTSGSSSPQLKTSYTYDPHMGLLLTSTDPNSLVTTLTYDNLGRTLTSQVGSLPATNYTYTDSSPWTVKVCSTVQANNIACKKSILDSQGRTVTSQLLDGSGTLYSAIDMQFDSFGRAYRISNPYTGTAAYWTQTYFDALGRVYKTTLPAPDNSTASISYADNASTTTNPAGKQRKAVADGLGRLTSVYEPDPSNGNALTVLTSYTYSVLDQLTKVSQGVQTRSYTYDALRRILSNTNPEGGMTCFGSITGSTCNTDGYDSNNNLLKRTDPRGVLTTYSYDTLNRLAQVTYNVGTTGVPATSTVALTYGLDSSCISSHGTGCIGQIVTMTDGSGSENYSYNSFEQLTQLNKVIGTTTYATSYLYNLAGQPTQITYPSGRVVQQSVDATGRLCEVAQSTTACGTAASPYATGYSYNAANQVTGFKYGNGIFASFGFTLDRLQVSCLDYSTTNRNGTCTHDSTTKFGLGYSHGTTGSNNGQITGITDSVDTGRSSNYTYDALNRLASAATTGSAAYPAWGLSWTYDRYGNATNQTQKAGSPPYYNLMVTSSTNHITGTPYAYDTNGNMTNDGYNILVYDANNRTLSATNVSTSGAYTYDGHDMRVKKCLPNCTTPTSSTVYIFQGSKVIAEYDNGAAPSAPSREYVFGGSSLLAKIDPSGTKYYHQDHISNRLVTSSTGATLAQMGHFPFGESWYDATSDKLLFTTYERDAESGNDYAIARSYMNRLGRFTTLDPLLGNISSPQSLNRFSYVTNDPVNLIDPMGRGPMHPECSPKLSCRFGGACGDDWSGDCGGGGGGGCYLDGLSTSCAQVSGALQSGSAVNCNGPCSGFNSNGTFVLFVASEGASGYVAFSDVTQGLNEWDGHLYSASDWATFMDNRIETLRASLADAISLASNSSDGSNWNDIYNSLQYRGSGGGNGDFGYLGNVADLGLSFPIGDFGTGCEWSCRAGSMPSLHYDNSMFHIDTANPSWGFGEGFFIHSFGDVLLGHINPGVPMLH
jgi:RHS repeat-associated protein